MAKVIWAPSALNDIDSIAEFISRDSVYHASLFVDRIIEIADRLKGFPVLYPALFRFTQKVCKWTLLAGLLCRYL